MSDQLMSKQQSWPFPCIKPKFEGRLLPDEVVRSVALFALPTHPLKEVFLELLATIEFWMYWHSMDEEYPDDSFIANFFGTNVLVNLQFIFLFLFFLSNEGY